MRNNDWNSAILARSTEEKKDIEVLRRLAARAQVLSRFTKKADGKNIGAEREARARRQSDEEDIVGITVKRAGLEADRLGNTVAAKRDERASANRTVTLIAGIDRRSIQRRSIVESAGLLARHLMNGTVRRTENVRRDPTICAGYSRWIFFSCECFV